MSVYLCLGVGGAAYLSLLRYCGGSLFFSIFFRYCFRVGCSLSWWSYKHSYLMPDLHIFIYNDV